VRQLLRSTFYPTPSQTEQAVPSKPRHKEAPSLFNTCVPFRDEGHGAAIVISTTLWRRTWDPPWSDVALLTPPPVAFSVTSSLAPLRMRRHPSSLRPKTVLDAPAAPWKVYPVLGHLAPVAPSLSMSSISLSTETTFILSFERFRFGFPHDNAMSSPDYP